MLKQDFIYPEGIYLDGNSLGLASRSSILTIERRLKEWQNLAVHGWQSWFTLSESLSGDLAGLVGAIPHEVIATGGITVNLHTLLATFYKPTATKKYIVATSLDFSSDLYAMQSWTQHYGTELRLISSRDGYTLTDEDIEAAFQDDVALIVLPTVLFASGQLLNIERFAKLAQKKEILLGVDAAHSIGSVPHAFHDWGVDFAVWYSYKYLNAGPGACGGIFVHEKHFHQTPALKGWWGHQKNTMFNMHPHFTHEPGAAAYQISTPSILALAGLEGSLEQFKKVNINDIRKHSLELTTYLMKLIEQHLPEFEIVTPSEEECRGGHVSVRHVHARLLSLALRARSIVPDFRFPDMLRMAPVALYNTKLELDETVHVLRELLDTKAYLKFQDEVNEEVCLFPV